MVISASWRFKNARRPILLRRVWSLASADAAKAFNSFDVHRAIQYRYDIEPAVDDAYRSGLTFLELARKWKHVSLMRR